MTSETPSDADPHAIRLRFRATKGVTAEEVELAITVGGKPVRLLSPDEKPLREGGWLALRAAGFPSEAEARAYGRKLQTALQIVSVRMFWGVDVGEGKATAMFFKGITDEWEKQGDYVRPNVHGLDVFPDRERTFWTSFSGRASVSVNPDEVEMELARMIELVPDEEPARFDPLRLMNEALISAEPAAQLVLALAAVEMLAQGEDWTCAQKASLERLANAAEADGVLDGAERDEVVQSVRRSMHRMGIRQGLKRLMLSLDLESLWKSFDGLYGKRSQLLHGLTYAPPSERSALVMPALQLCGRIVLSALEKEIPGVIEGIDDRYPKAPPLAS